MKINLEFYFATNPPPTDVLIEHLAYAITTDFKETQLSDIRTTPFDGPEVFDDRVQTEEYTGPRPAGPDIKIKYDEDQWPVGSPADAPRTPWPLIDRVVRGLRGNK